MLLYVAVCCSGVMLVSVTVCGAVFQCGDDGDFLFVAIYWSVVMVVIVTLYGSVLQ